VLSLVLFGIASHVTFMVVSEYTVRSYGLWSASAVGAQSFVREISSGCLVLVSEPMYKGLGYQWVSLKFYLQP
jgi:MFS transporter, DHA1 family, multidrug resistance protein